MNLIKPKRLQKGDTIAIIAPAGEVNIQKIEKAKQQIETLGYKVKLGSNIKKQKHYSHEKNSTLYHMLCRQCSPAGRDTDYTYRQEPDHLHRRHASVGYQLCGHPQL